MSDLRETTSETSFVLRGRTPLPNSASPGPEHAWDAVRQLWVSAASGRALVLDHVARHGAAAAGPGDRVPMEGAVRASNFGETTMTKTSEGTDRSETVSASTFGETTHTRTAEGTDQREVVASEFGETVMTETGEGTDQSESVVSGADEGAAVRAGRGIAPGPAMSSFGETVITATREGTDQQEGVA